MRKAVKRYCHECKKPTVTVITKRNKKFCAKCGRPKPDVDKEFKIISNILFFLFVLVIIAGLYSILTLIDLLWS